MPVLSKAQAAVEISRRFIAIAQGVAACLCWGALHNRTMIFAALPDYSGNLFTVHLTCVWVEGIKAAINAVHSAGVLSLALSVLLTGYIAVGQLMLNVKCVCCSRRPSCAMCVISVLGQLLACIMCPICAGATPKRNITCCTLDCAAGTKQPREGYVATRRAW